MLKETNKNVPWKEQRLFNKLVYNWIFIPVGVALITGVVILVNQIFRALSFNFPANVASMLLVGFVLIIGDNILPKGVIQSIVKLLNPAISFLMDWMIIFFIPPLITIFNSAVFPGGMDIVKLIIIFFVGLLIFIPLVGYSVHFMGILFDKIKKGHKKESNKDTNNASNPKDKMNTSNPKDTMNVSNPKDTMNKSNPKDTLNKSNENNQMMISIVIESENNKSEFYPGNFDDKTSHVSDKTSYISDKTSYNISDRQSHFSDETYDENEWDITSKNHPTATTITVNNNAEMVEIQDFKKLSPMHAFNSIGKDDKNLNPSLVVDEPSFVPFTSSEEKTKFQWKSSAIPSKHNIITYLIIFALSWIPAALWGIRQPLHISINVLAYFAGLCVPDKIRVLLHPLISCTAISYLLLFIESLVFGHSFTEELTLYSNGSKYLLYINDTSLPFPLAGEMLFCVLDATVVALSFRIFEHYKLIVKHLFELVGTIIVMSFLSMLIHTILCRLVHVTPVYALSMTSRSATTPLAVQVVDLLGSDMAIAVVIVAFTGVFTDIIGLPYLKLLHFPLKDSLAHGACMGCAGHAVATAGLIKKYPSASAVSSISFVLFSTFCVIWASIPMVTSFFRAVAGI